MLQFDWDKVSGADRKPCHLLFKFWLDKRHHKYCYCQALGFEKRMQLTLVHEELFNNAIFTRDIFEALPDLGCKLGVLAGESFIPMEHKAGIKNRSCQYLSWNGSTRVNTQSCATDASQPIFFVALKPGKQCGRNGSLSRTVHKIRTHHAQTEMVVRFKRIRNKHNFCRRIDFATVCIRTEVFSTCTWSKGMRQGLRSSKPPKVGD